MKTIFSMGFASQDFFGVQPARYPSLGQTTVDGNKILADISAGESKMASVNQWLDSHPNYATLLGNQLSTWNNLMAQANNNYDAVTVVGQRLATNDSGAWFITTSEQDAVNNWISAMNQLYQITSQNFNLIRPTAPMAPMTPGTAAKAPVPAKAPAAAPSSGPSPLVIGAGAIAAVGLLALVVNR